MKKIFFLVFILAIMQMKAFSQSCLPEGITFTTQAQIDNFQVDYPGCTGIQGDVRISGNDISDLQGISVVDSIFGKLTLGSNGKGNNPNLRDLGGLENLAYIGGSLKLNYNDSLVNIHGLSGLTRIGDGIKFYSNNRLLDLVGLEGIDSIFGSIDIQSNNHLSSLAGLNNLVYIGGYLYLSSHSGGLINLTGLDNLTFVAGGVGIEENEDLTSLTGLENLSFTNSLEISFNSSLVSLSGLEGLDSIGEDMTLIYNGLLPNLTGMEGVTSIGGELVIEYNYSLTSLEGLENVNPVSISDLSIMDNPNLSACNILSICEYLADPNGHIDIYRNANGCNNPNEIAENCGITLSCLPYGNYHFLTQSDLDSFPAYFPDCNILEGYVEIEGEDITHLDSLYGIDTINGTLIICRNDNLSSLAGLNNLKTIEGSLIIGELECSGNDELNDLEGLNNLTSIGYDLVIMDNNGLMTLSGPDNLTEIGNELIVMGNGSLINLHGLDNLISTNYIYIDENYSLLNLNGLQSVTNANNISIKYNPALFSIYGIANVDGDSIDLLIISHNDNLSDCDVKSVCDYLAMQGGYLEIIDNNTGCNSPEEVEAACDVGIGESSVVSHQSSVVSYPNPTDDISHFTFHISQCQWVILKVFDMQGREVATIIDEELQAGSHEVTWNAENLPPGIYFYRISTIDHRQSAIGKIVVVR
jgi:hypothetical protein